MKRKNKNNIGVRLLRNVFGCYFIVALVVTIAQLVSEYRHTRESTFEELSNIGATIQKNLALALWNFDLEQLGSVIEGTNKFDIVTGSRIVDAQGSVLVENLGADILEELTALASGTSQATSQATSEVNAANTARATTEELSAIAAYGDGMVYQPTRGGERNRLRLYEYRFPIVYANSDQNIHELIGYSSLYTKEGVIIEKVRYSFILIILNSIIKTVALWLFFLIFVERLVARPLRVLTEATQAVDTNNPETLGKHSQLGELDKVDRGDEMSSLVTSFRAMQRSIASNMETIDRQHRTLEERVQQRTAELEEKNRELTHMSLHDALTGLPNRYAFDERLQQLLEKSQGEDDQFSVASIDLKKFKLINDNHGHLAGDRILKEVARRIEGIVGTSGMVARMGGDEFAILLPDTDLQAATLIGEKLAACTIKPVKMDGKSLYVGLNIGFALYPQDGRTAKMLYKEADDAMYEAKRSSRSLGTSGGLC